MGRRAWLAACALFAVPASAAIAGNYDDRLAALTQGQPPQVHAFIDRRLACDHWAGEEPYDAPRRAEINRAWRKLRCDALDRDEAALRERYDRNYAVLKALTASKDFLPD